MKVAKAIVAVIGATIVSLQATLDDGVFGSQDYVTVAIAFITAVGVYLIPNQQA
jgi:hypothetical protein